MVYALSNTHWLAITLGVSLAALTAAILAWLFRGARTPGGAAASAIAGGILAGVLLGPGVLGAVAPGPHRAAFTGGIAEHRAYADKLFEARGAVAALEMSGVTPVAIDEYEQRAMADLEPLREAVDIARFERRGAWDFTLAIAGAAMLALLPLAGITRIRGEIPFAARKAALAAGPASFLLAGGIVLATVGAFTRWGWSSAALLFASACAAGWFAAPIDRIARERPRAVRESFVSGLFAFALACAVLLWTLTDRRAWLVSAGFMGALLVWAVLKAAPPGRIVRFKAKALTLHIVAPAVVALATMRVDPLPVARDPAFWIVLLAAIIACTDGRWLGALLGARTLDASTGLLTKRSVEIATAHTVAGVGLPQAALLAILAAGGPIPQPMLAAGLLAALLVETCAGGYRWAAAWIERGIGRA